MAFFTSLSIEMVIFINDKWILSTDNGSRQVCHFTCIRRYPWIISQTIFAIRYFHVFEREVPLQQAIISCVSIINGLLWQKKKRGGAFNHISCWLLRI